MKSKIIAFISFWPTIFAAIYIATTLIVFANIGNNTPEKWLVSFTEIVSAMFVPTFWLFFGTIIYFLVQIFKNKIVPENQRLNWGAAIFFLGLISFPIFWFKYLKEK